MALKRITLRLTPEQEQTLGSWANARGLSVNDVVRAALAEHITLWPQDEIAWGGYRPERIMIDVANGQARIVRVPRVQQTGWQFEEALNSDELADEAAEAVSAQGGHITLSGQYKCPDALAKRAVWT